MCCICWNCRGLGSDATVREVRDLATCFKPTVFCVLETQLHKTRVEGLASVLGYDSCFAVSSSGRSGGLEIFWNSETNIELLPFSQYHIDAIITERGSDPWRLTCVYGEPQTSERFKTWDALKFVCSSSGLPWMCIGDLDRRASCRERVSLLV